MVNAFIDVRWYTNRSVSISLSTSPRWRKKLEEWGRQKGTELASHCRMQSWAVVKGRGSNKGSCFPRQQGVCMLGLLLGCHVDHQVHHTVAVSILVVIPAGTEMLSGPFLYVNAPPPRALNCLRRLPMHFLWSMQHPPPPSITGRRPQPFQAWNHFTPETFKCWSHPNSASALCFVTHCLLVLMNSTQATELPSPYPSEPSHHPKAVRTRKPAWRNGRSVQCQHPHQRWRNGCHRWSHRRQPEQREYGQTPSPHS